MFFYKFGGNNVSDFDAGDTCKLACKHCIFVFLALKRVKGAFIENGLYTKLYKIPKPVFEAN